MNQIGSHHALFFISREGEISREEITSYFMRGMSVCAKLGFNLHNLHNFHETTYKRPTFCDICGGFVSVSTKDRLICGFMTFLCTLSNFFPLFALVMGSHKTRLPLQRLENTILINLFPIYMCISKKNYIVKMQHFKK